MEFHPIIFALIAYGVAAVIALCVAFIVKIIALIVHKKNGAGEEGAKPGSGVQ